MNKLLIVGAGGHGRVIKELAMTTCAYDVIEYVESYLKATKNIEKRTLWI